MLSTTVKAYAQMEPGQPIIPYTFELGEIGAEEVEVAVEYCGLCHSDLSMSKNAWGMTKFPFVGGHEVAGRVIAIGKEVKTVKVGQKVGIGWNSESCMGCKQCLAGDHNLCLNVEDMIVGRHGGFADKVRCHWAWAVPIPEALDISKVGPLFCGGITVFNPIVQYDIKPTDRVGVVGIGGLGHMALQFLNKWGCEVTAFTSSDAKAAEAKSMGAHKTVNSRDSAQINNVAGSLDFILSTVNVTLDWQAMLAALAPRGRLHMVGAVLEPISVGVFPMLVGQKSISASPLGSPATTAMMLDFSARHNIAPITETFPMSQINEAFEHLESGNARYRIVLKNDII